MKREYDFAGVRRRPENTAGQEPHHKSNQMMTCWSGSASRPMRLAWPETDKMRNRSQIGKNRHKHHRSGMRSTPDPAAGSGAERKGEWQEHQVGLVAQRTAPATS